MFCKKGVLRNLAKFIGKHLCQSLFFNEVAGLNFNKKETLAAPLAQVFSCEFCEISKNTFLFRTPKDWGLKAVNCCCKALYLNCFSKIIVTTRLCHSSENLKVILQCSIHEKTGSYLFFKFYFVDNKRKCHYTKKFYIKSFFSKCDQICRKMRICSHLLKKSLTENFNFCAMFVDS